MILPLRIALTNRPVVQAMTGFDSVSEDSIHGGLSQVFRQIIMVVVVRMCGRGDH